jgi:hypothetical protein
MVMDEREDYYDSLIMDHDVEMVVMDPMDEALVGLSPKKMIISKNKDHVSKQNWVDFFFAYR